jgi:hypothetical protein
LFSATIFLRDLRIATHPEEWSTTSMHGAEEIPTKCIPDWSYERAITQFN